MHNNKNNNIILIIINGIKRGRKMVQVTNEVKQRIIAAAEQLHESNPDRMPTVAEVRQIAQANMNDVSVVMKEWRQNKLMPVKRIEEEAPNEIQIEAKALVTKIWSMAREQADVKLREAETRFTEERYQAEQLRSELSEACDGLQEQLEEATGANKLLVTQQSSKDEEIELLKERLNRAEEAERLATARNIELEKHIGTQAKDIQKLEKSLSEKDIKISDLTASVDQARTAYTEEKFKLNEVHNKQVTELEKRIIEMQGQVNTAESTTKQAKEHIQDLKGALEKQQKQNESLQQQLEKVAKNEPTTKPPVKSEKKRSGSNAETTVKKTTRSTASKDDPDQEK